MNQLSTNIKLKKIVQQNWSFFGPYALLLVGIGMLQVGFSQGSLSRSINQLHAPWADVFFKYMTQVGDGFFAVFVIVVLLFIQRQWAGIAGLSFLISGIITQFLKRVVFDDEVRPSKFFEGQWAGFHRVEGVDLLTYNSFPSGHTTSAFAVFCLLALLVHDKRWGVIFLILACLVGYSRLYLFQHFLIDVYVGSLIGTFTTLLLYYYFHHRKKKLGKTKIHL